ncbi:MAG TPA: peptide deformylase [Clostridiales bacterium]|nr:MAG: peptide deformylase [Clostridiales bacterium GWD2_32_19]HCC07187.1 peptide deformylase [Clostridiales bacterium]
MALRKVRIEGDEILRKISKEVTKIDKKLLQLLDDMTATMYKYDGVGLAAPQVGVLKRVVVVDIGEGVIELINPVLIESYDEKVCKEGCLSVPCIYGQVIRPCKIKVKALDRHGKEFLLEAEEFMAQAICHELDHLEGILFIDKASNLERVEE